MRVSVDKWYLDLVTPSGGAWIGYASRVRVGPVRFGYVGRLEGGEGRRSRSVHRAGLRSDLPVEEEGAIRWDPRALAVSGRWDDGRAAAARTLGDGDPALTWHVRALAADAHVRDGDEVLAGAGYVERLTLDGSLDLGIDTLHWGRWIADGDADGPRSIVWIRWVGPRPLAVILADGADVGAEQIDAERVSGGHGELVLDPRSVLRTGGLGETVLAKLPGSVRRLAKRMGGWEETKWVSRGHLARPDGGRSEGWAIHEVVHFGGRR